ncbi:unnamed protein product, partial [Mesorhabditis spiculigera]
MLRKLKAQVTQVANEQPMTSMENPNFLLNDEPASTRRASNTSSGPAFASKEDEVDELRHQIRDEKNFSTELKKELDRLHAVFSQSQDVPKEEVPYLMQQIQMLEAGKSMVTQRMLELEKEGGTLKRQAESAFQDKKEVMDRLKALTQKVRTLTEDNEEKKTENAVMCDELLRVKSAMADLEKEMDKLSQTLDERPSEDDVAVLRKELVRAQQLMDDITLQKDAEIQKQIEDLHSLTSERDKLKFVVGEMERQIREQGEGSSKASEQLSGLSEKAATTAKDLEAAKRELEEVRQQLKNKTNEAAAVSEKAATLEADLSARNDKIRQLEEELHTGKSSIEGSNEILVKKEQKLLEAQQTLNQANETQKSLEAKIQELEGQLDAEKQAAKRLTSEKNELDEKVAALVGKLTAEGEQLKNKDSHAQAQESKLQQLGDANEELTRTVAKKDEAIKELRLQLETQTKEIATLKDNASDLLSKISEGEGGAKMAIDQLNEEKKKLLEDITLLGESLKEQKSEAEEQTENLKKELKHKERDHVEEIKKRSQAHEALSSQLNILNEELVKKSNQFEEIEKEREEERQKNAAHFAKLKEAIVARDGSLTAANGQIEELTSQVAALQKRVEEKDKALVDSKNQIEHSLDTVKLAEEKAKQMAELLRNVENERSQIRDELDSTRKENEILQQNLNALTSDLAEKQKHFSSKVSMLEGQLEENLRTNDEMLQVNRELTHAKEKLEKEKAAVEAKLNLESAQSEETSGKLSQLSLELEMERSARSTAEENAKQKEIELADLHRQIEESSEREKLDQTRVRELEEEKLSIMRNAEEQFQDDCKRIKEYEEKVKSYDAEFTKLSEELNEREEKIESLNKATSRLETVIAQKDEEILEVGDRLKQFEGTLAQELASFEQRESIVSGKVIELENQLDAANLTEGKLRSELATNQKEMDHMKDQNSKQTKQIAKLQEAYESVNKQLVEERIEATAKYNEKQEEMVALQHQLDLANESLLALQDKSASELSASERKVESLLSEISTKQSEIDGVERTLTELGGKNAELLQQVASWEDEKKALIERCLNTESDLDFERERALENKRRFDDALGAMHELGRANQSLQMDMSKQLSRKWLDDNEAVNCTTCGKGFSLTVRKHHCRVCGLIFCGTCSNHTVKLASHKNPVRACETCYQEVLSR